MPGLTLFKSPEGLIGTYMHERIHVWQQTSGGKRPYEKQNHYKETISNPLKLNEVHACFVNIEFMKLISSSDFKSTIISQELYKEKNYRTLYITSETELNNKAFSIKDDIFAFLIENKKEGGFKMGPSYYKFK